MRELWTTGTLHNRVRLIAGSFLTKNLNIHWREEGLRWFEDTLLDADLAQSERFDAQGEYLKRWLPELAEVPLPWVRRPF